ncbi:hypothetical protein PT2222_170138 [Paraburkholderia tropica]
MHFLCVVRDAVRAPRPRHAVLIAGVGVADHFHQMRVEIREIRQLRFIELLIHAGLDLPRHIRRRWHDHVVTGTAGEQFGLQRVVAVVAVVTHLDAGLLLERGHRVLRNIVGPVVDVDLCVVRDGGLGGDGGEREHRGGARHGDGALERVVKFHPASLALIRRLIRRRHARLRARHPRERTRRT